MRRRGFIGFLSGAAIAKRDGPVLAVLGLRPIGLFQIRAFGVPVMKRRYHFGTANVIPLREVARIGALINDLDRRTQLLDCDIAAEEGRAQVFNHSDAAYPIAARFLGVRRDNLKATIATLERRLATLQGCGEASRLGKRWTEAPPL